MPPNEQSLAKALDALQQVELQSFTATPPTIGPFGQSTLSWKASAPSGVHFELDGRQVPRVGSQIVRPGATSTFNLTARALTLSSLVGQRTVTVDLDACMLLSVPEEDVRAQLQAVIDGLLAQDEHLTQKSPPLLDVTPSGIVMKLRFEVHLKHSRNPDFNVDALIGLAVHDGVIKPFFLQFSAELHFSFLEEALNIAIDATAGLLAGGPFLHIAFAQAESAAAANARQQILDGIGKAIDSFLAVAPAGWSPHSVFLRDDGLDVRICPRPGKALVGSFRDPGFQLTALRRGPYGGKPKSRTRTKPSRSRGAS